MTEFVFYSESDVFGGHEKMALAAYVAIRKYVDDITIEWLVNADNQVLVKALDEAGAHYVSLEDPTQVSIFRHPVRAFQKVRTNAAQIQRLSPCLLVLIQGNIYSSYCGALSAKYARQPFCSYLPMVFRISDARSFQFPAVADFLWSWLYQTIPAFITIDPEQAARLRRENAKASIEIVENWVPKSQQVYAGLDAKVKLDVSAEKKVLTVIGRIEFSHKCQDWVLEQLANDPFMNDKVVLFVGDGSDKERLQSMLTRDLQDRFRILEWRSDLGAVYAATDVLLIPSKREGVPLVMLEALGYRRPVVGTDRDGMRSWLPPEWRFEWGDLVGFKRAIERALGPTSFEVWQKLQARLSEAQDEERFAKQFHDALVRIVRF
jgi:glycosyltransferase involved in cell wall biosynthesis